MINCWSSLFSSHNYSNTLCSLIVYDIIKYHHIAIKTIANAEKLYPINTQYYEHKPLMIISCTIKCTSYFYYKFQKTKRQLKSSIQYSQQESDPTKLLKQPTIERLLRPTNFTAHTALPLHCYIKPQIILNFLIKPTF